MVGILMGSKTAEYDTSLPRVLTSAAREAGMIYDMSQPTFRLCMVLRRRRMIDRPGPAEIVETMATRCRPKVHQSSIYN